MSFRSWYLLSVQTSHFSAWMSDVAPTSSESSSSALLTSHRSTLDAVVGGLESFGEPARLGSSELRYYQGAELWRHAAATASCFVRQLAPLFPPCPPRPRRACLPPWAARAPGAAGSTALCRRVSPGPILVANSSEAKKARRSSASGPSAGPAAPARLPAFLGAASAGHGRLNGTAPTGGDATQLVQPLV